MNGSSNPKARYQCQEIAVWYHHNLSGPARQTQKSARPNTKSVQTKRSKEMITEMVRLKGLSNPLFRESHTITPFHGKTATNIQAVTRCMSNIHPGIGHSKP